MVNLVHSDLIDSDYDEDESMCAMVEGMKSSKDKVFQEIRQLREKYSADLVGLLVDNGKYCGCGSFFTANSSGYDSNEAFFVVNSHCATNQFSFAHELGHSFVSRSTLIFLNIFMSFNMNS